MDGGGGTLTSSVGDERLVVATWLGDGKTKRMVWIRGEQWEARCDTHTKANKLTGGEIRWRAARPALEKKRAKATRQRSGDKEVGTS